MHVWLSGIQALPAPLTEGKLIFLARTFYLNRDKVNISTGSRNVLLILRELFSPSYILLYYGVSSFRAKQGVFWVYICQVFVPFCVLAKFVPGRYFISSPSWLPLSNNEYWNQSGGSDCFPYLLLHLVPRSIGRPGWNFPELTKNSRPVESLAMVTLQKL
jgi:hypothetical protein